MSAPGLRTGAVLAGVAVILGAFGAHALKERLDADALAIWDTAVQYQAWHSLALVLHGLVRSQAAASGRAPRRLSGLPGWAFLFGIVAFSGSLYGLALGGPRWLGPVTPLGGMAFIVGWAGFALTARPADAEIDA